jgi:diaminopimelate decarboxylase
VYDLKTLAANADTALAFPHAYGLTARFAMKASPNKAILQLFDAKVKRWRQHAGDHKGV